VKSAQDEEILNRVCREVAPYTMVPQAALLFTLESALQSIEMNLKGSIVECGTWKGGCSFGMLLVQRYRYGKIIKPVWMFDSFQGLPPADERDGPLAKAYQRDVDSPYYYDNCSAALAEVRTAITRFGFSEDECRVVPGWFSDSLPSKTTTLGHEGIALLRVDCDWYEPVRFVLDTLLPHTTDDARVILDDYYFWDGCARATHDFLASSGQAYRIRTIGEFVGAWFEKNAGRSGFLSPL
jgi:hypothetical protein